MTQRINWIDNAKAIGIILVVYGHVILGVHDAGLWRDTTNYSFQHSLVYTSHMPLFFLLSGIFAITWVKRAPKIAIWQKFRTLLIPYFIWGIIQAGVMQVFAKNTNNGQGLGNAIQLPFLPYAQFWFLYDLFWIFILYYLAIHVMKIPEKCFLAFSGLIFIVSPLMTSWEFWRIFYYLIFFVIGTFVLRYADCLHRINPWLNACLFLILNIAFFIMKLPLLAHNVFSLIVALSGSILIIQIAQLIHHRWVTYIGRNSMAIYLLHIMFTAGSRIMLMKLGLDNLILQIVVGLTLGILLPVLVVQLAVKLHIKEWLF